MKFWMVPLALVAACVCGLAAAGTIDRYAPNSVQEISIVNAGGAVGYTPVIATAQDGIVHDVQATVSADLRYVQINLRPSAAVIEQIDNFEVITGGFFDF